MTSHWLQLTSGPCFCNSTLSTPATGFLVWFLYSCFCLEPSGLDPCYCFDADSAVECLACVPGSELFLVPISPLPWILMPCFQLPPFLRPQCFAPAYLLLHIGFPGFWPLAMPWPWACFNPWLNILDSVWHPVLWPLSVASASESWSPPPPYMSRSYLWHC